MAWACAGPLAAALGLPRSSRRLRKCPLGLQFVFHSGSLGASCSEFAFNGSWLGTSGLHRAPCCVLIHICAWHLGRSNMVRRDGTRKPVSLNAKGWLASADAKGEGAGCRRWAVRPRLQDREGLGGSGADLGPVLTWEPWRGQFCFQSLNCCSRHS